MIMTWTSGGDLDTIHAIIRSTTCNKMHHEYTTITESFLVNHENNFDPFVVLISHTYRTFIIINCYISGAGFQV